MRLLLFVPLLFLISCYPTGHDFYQTAATAETTPVESSGDAADDMAIWVHPQNPAKSLIIGSDKKRGLEFYALTGEKVADFPHAAFNNVDVRQSVQIGKDTMDLIGCSNTDENSLSIFLFSPDSLKLTELIDSTLPGPPDGIYGFSFFLSPVNGFLYAFVTGRNGTLDQWLLKASSQPGKITGILVRRMQFQGKCEGIVADDDNGILYVAEEQMGIWKVPAEPDQSTSRARVDLLRSNPNLAADLEGLALYKGSSPEEGYLVASSQGNSSFAVFQRQGVNIYVGSFRIKANDELGIDKVTNSDGIEVTALPLGNEFPYGLFVAQDDVNEAPEGMQRQNFKLIPWEKIAVAFKTPLLPANR